MIVYRLERFPSEGSPEGEDVDEYFSSYSTALQRRRQLLYDREAADGELSIEKLILVDMPEKQLVLRILNRTGYILHREVMLPGIEEIDEEEY